MCNNGFCGNNMCWIIILILLFCNGCGSNYSNNGCGCDHNCGCC